MTKKKILIVNEFSQLGTGFSTYMYYLLPKLQATGKYEIAELATYVHKLHPKIEDAPWKVYPNEPDPNNPMEQQAYGQDKINQFGKWRFDEVCLDFKPDIVISIRDWWMDAWIEKSPFRKHFKWITMPTVDGEPQKPEWLDTYADADKLLTYSHWGKNLLERQSGGRLKVAGVASPCTDLEIFKPPHDKAKLRAEFGLSQDIFIIQTVMRNQPRKLYPDILKVFAKFLELCESNGNHELAKKSYLYFHTTYPDLGWDLPSELRKHKLSHKVLFTYMCDSCGSVFPSFFQSEATVCRSCLQPTARLPNTSIGVDRAILAKIMSTADLYIQYSVCEGFGMPINDAKACGVPVMAVDYSAMTEQVYNGGGIPLPVQRYFQESVTQTNQLRALPDNDETARKIYEYATGPEETRKRLELEARECVEKYYNWDDCAKIWEKIIDETNCPEQTQTWFSPPQVIKPELAIPNNMDNTQFVKWCYSNILRRPDLINSTIAQKTIALLTLGYEPGQTEDGKPIRIPLDRQKIINSMLSYVNQHNSLESIRYNRLVKGVDNSKPKIGFITV
jgi:glycosyltransferase involved in cell wall biosynthesis